MVWSERGEAEPPQGHLVAISSGWGGMRCAAASVWQAGMEGSRIPAPYCILRDVSSSKDQLQHIPEGPTIWNSSWD